MAFLKPPFSFPRPRAILCLCAAIASVALTGCAEWGVSRRITVRTNPPGAQVYIDNYEIGTSPCSTFFTYYGTREIRIVKDGYETLVVRQPFPTPWYEYTPIDFFSENFWPSKTIDNRVVEYNLVPQQMAPSGLLLGRAEQLRRQTQPRPPAYIPPGGPLGPVNSGAPLSPGQPTLSPQFSGGLPPSTSIPAFTPSNASPSGALWPSNGIR